MATPNVGILTKAGKNLIDQVNAGQTKIIFSKIVFSSMNNNQLTDDQIKALTTVTPQEIVVKNPKVTLDNNTGETRIRATGNNKALNDGVYVKTYAVYAKNDSGNEILYGITVSPNPNYLPEYDGVTPQAVTYSYKVNISNTSNITFTNSNDVYVSDTDLAEALQPYAKTIDVNQQLDKKVNTTDTANWQKYPITDAKGSLTTYVGPDYQYTSIKQLLDNSANGFYTTYIDLKDPDTPDSSDNLRGIIQIQGNRVWGILTGELTKVSYYVGGAYYGNTSDLNWIQLADDSAVVHSTDMRKPASDVAGIEEVNAKQDKIGYTPADDSTVLHNNSLNRITTDDSGIIIGNEQNFGIIKRSGSQAGIAIGFGKNFRFMTTNDAILNSNSGYHDVWNIAPTGQISILGGAYFTPADDSKVAHLSGANNFDTVPTVKNNPLLLASSLPSDLARTGSDQEFTGKNTFDTAPIDKTTGNPYITKDGVPSIPSDVARTGQANTFTAAQTFSIAPTIKDASKDKGDNQAATMADLQAALAKLPKTWNGTQTQFDAIKTKDPNTYYYIYDDDAS